MAKDAEKLDAQADRIRELRKFARVSQEVVAGAVGVTLRAYQRWERGEGEINTENIKKLASYFSTTPDYIEYGVAARDRGATPDLSDQNVLALLARMEQKLDKLMAAATADGAHLTARQHVDLERFEALVERMEAQSNGQAPPRSARARRSPRASDKPAA